MAEAVFARNVSAIKEERVAASKKLKGASAASLASFGLTLGKKKTDWVQAVRGALYCSKICSYAQGFALMTAAARDQQWDLNLGQIASIFRGGCIIRARFLQKITDAYTRNPKLANLLLDPYFTGVVKKEQVAWRAVVARAAVDGLPVPAFSSALSYYDSYRAPLLPANLLQAQRDYFGAHTYERTDRPRGEFYHLDWPEQNRPELRV
jgi:6-phosphogluconate dehydrogenase